MFTQWADVNKLADSLDTYHANYDRFDKPKASVLGAVSNASQGGQYNMANKNVYPRDKSVSTVSVANALSLMLVSHVTWQILLFQV